MKQGNNRRSRSRGNGKRYPNQRGGVFESNGPEVKVRGTAHQVLEKYLSLARDANSAGDRISAEGYFQFAEHYYRVINAEGGPNQTGSMSQDGQENQQGRRSRNRNQQPSKSKDEKASVNGEKKSVDPESRDVQISDHDNEKKEEVVASPE